MDEVLCGVDALQRLEGVQLHPDGLLSLLLRLLALEDELVLGEEHVRQVRQFQILGQAGLIDVYVSYDDKTAENRTNVLTSPLALCS